MVGIKESSPSRELFKRLYQKVKPTGQEVRQLTGRPALLRDEHMGGVVNNTKKGQIAFTPEVRFAQTGQDTKYFPKTTADLHFTVAHIEPRPGVAVVRTRIPDRLAILSFEDVVEASFSQEDPGLDRILEEGLKYNPKINTLEDLRKMTKWVHETVPYKEVPYELDANFTPIGTIVNQHGAVCRHQAAIAFGLLELRKVRSTIVVGKGLGYYSGDSLHDPRGHMFLEVPLGNTDEPYIADPTSGAAGTKRHMIATLTYDPFIFERTYPTRFESVFLR